MLNKDNCRPKLNYYVQSYALPYTSCISRLKVVHSVVVEPTKGLAKAEKKAIDENQRAVAYYRKLRAFIQMLLGSKFAIENLGDGFNVKVLMFLEVGGFWEEIDFEFLKEVFKDKVLDLVDQGNSVPISFSDGGIINFFDRRSPKLLKDALGFQRASIQKKKGLNFQNGFLVLNDINNINNINDRNTFIINKNSSTGLNIKSLMLNYCLPFSYSQDQLPTFDFFKILYEILCFNKQSLFKLRSLFKIILEGPYTDLHTGFFLYGPPGSGKSSIVTLLTSFIGAVQVFNCRPKDFEHEFTLQNCVNKRLVLINEVGFLPQEASNHIKILLGRDQVNASVKFSNVRKSEVFNGTIVMTSNNTPTVLQSDDGFLDRFLDIKTQRIVSEQPINLKVLLEQNLIALVNWALLMPFTDLVVRAKEVNNVKDFLNNRLLEFMTEELTFDKNGLLSINTLSDRLLSEAQFIGQKRLPTAMSMANQVISFSLQFWNVKVDIIRKYCYINELAEGILTGTSTIKHDLNYTWLEEYSHDRFLIPPLISPQNINKDYKRFHLLKGIRAKTKDIS